MVIKNIFAIFLHFVVRWSIFLIVSLNGIYYKSPVHAEYAGDEKQNRHFELNTMKQTCDHNKSFKSKVFYYLCSAIWLIY